MNHAACCHYYSCNLAWCSQDLFCSVHHSLSWQIKMPLQALFTTFCLWNTSMSGNLWTSICLKICFQLCVFMCCMLCHRYMCDIYDKQMILSYKKYMFIIVVLNKTVIQWMEKPHIFLILQDIVKHWN